MGVLIGNVARKERRDTAANWTSNNPTPLDGEWCLESDTGFVKMGDGTTSWTSLKYLIATPLVTEITASGSLTIGTRNRIFKVDLSSGNISINQLAVPSFVGQTIHIYGEGSGLGDIAGGTGLYSNGVYFTENTGGVFLTAISLTEWRAKEGLTANYVSGGQTIHKTASGDMINFGSTATTSPQVYSVAFVSVITYPLISTVSATFASITNIAASSITGLTLIKNDGSTSPWRTEGKY